MRTTLLLSILLYTVFPTHSVCQSCSAWESRKSIEGNSTTFRLESYPWKITIDQDANVRIQNLQKNSSCRTQMESVVRVYLGSGNLIYFRSAEVSNDMLITLDGLSCREARKTRQFGVKSEAAVSRVLRTMGICGRK